MNTVLFNTKSDGSLLSTVWFAFPSVPSILRSIAQGFNPSLPFPQVLTRQTNGILNQPGDSIPPAVTGVRSVDRVPSSSMDRHYRLRRLPTPAPSQINVNLVGLPAFTVGNHSRSRDRGRHRKVPRAGSPLLLRSNNARRGLHFTFTLVLSSTS